MYKEVHFKEHEYPIVVNEDGTEIFYNGKPVNIVKTKSQGSRDYHNFIKLGKYYHMVSRLVAMAFVPNPRPDEYDKVMHMDSNSQNNYFKNLQWGTMRIVYQNSRVNGLKVGYGNHGPRSVEFRSTSPIHHKEALKIAKRLDKGEYAKDICKEYGVSEMSIRRIRKKYCKKKQVSPRYSLEMKKEVVNMAKETNFTHEDIAKQFNINVASLYRWLRYDRQGKLK